MDRQGWIGVDFDGTLVEYNEYKGPGSIGAPIPVMVARVKRWLEEGKDVRIFTARVGPGNEAEADIERRTIDRFCLRMFGRLLPITATKDYLMVECWDDRAVQVVPNTGLRVDGVQEPGLEPGDITEAMK